MSRPASVPPKETPLSRPKTLVATPNHHKAARTMSRHQIGVATPLRPLQVANSNRCRDTISPAQPQARSQHLNPVTTFLETNVCRDINFMSRPHLCTQWDFQVATPKIQVATSLCSPHRTPLSRPKKTLVATPNLLSPIQPGRDVHFWSRPRANQTRS